jgi:tetratricopeptide (TPR) repeat protein
MALAAPPWTGTAIQRLLARLSDLEASPDDPSVVVLAGETGRGKTFAVQTLYDLLAVERPGYWLPGLAPEWPPVSRQAVLDRRKRIVPGRDLRAEGEALRFLWVGVGASDGSRTGLDPAPGLTRQVHTLLEAEASAVRRRGRVRAEVFRVAADAAAELAPVVGRVKVAIDHMRELRDLARGETTDIVARESAAIREALEAAGSVIAKTSEQPVPLVIVVDDAQGVSYETLRLLSTVLGSADTGDGDFIQEETRTAPALPTLVLCTVWEHRLGSAGHSDPFREWLEDVEASGIAVERMRFDEFPESVARALLDAWPDGPGESDRELILNRLRKVQGQRPQGVVNQWALVNAIGRLEEERDPFRNELNVDQRIVAALSKSADQHLEERLEALRSRGEHGRKALAVFETLALYGSEVPVRLVEMLARGSGEIVELLIAGSLLHRSEPGERAVAGSQARALETLRLETDLYLYLSSRAAQQYRKEALASAAHDLLLWLANEVLPDELLRPPLVPLDAIAARLAPASRVVRAVAEETFGPAGPALDLALSLSGLAGRARPFDNVEPSIAALGMAYGGRLGVGRAQAEQALAACLHFGASRVTARVLTRWIDEWGALPAGRSDAILEHLGPNAEEPVLARPLGTALTLEGRTDDAIRLLTSAAEKQPTLLDALADTLVAAGRVKEAVEVLRPAAATLESAALKLSDLLVIEGDAQGAIDALRPTAARSEQAALRLSHLMLRHMDVDAAIGVLRDVAHTEQAAIRLATLLDSRELPAEAEKVLQPLASESPRAAIALAGLLERQGRIDQAVAVLEPDARRLGAVVRRLAQILVNAGRTDEAEMALRRMSDRSQEAARDLADLLLEQGRIAEAIEALEPTARELEQSAAKLAELLESQGRIDDAEAALRPVAGRTAGAAVALASMLERQGRWEEAISALRPTARRALPAALALARLLEMQGREEEALRVVDGVADRFDRAALAKVRYLERMGRGDEALATLERLAPRSASAALRFAEVLTAGGREEEAIATLRPLAPRFPSVALKLAQELESGGRDDEALAILKVAAPSSPAAAVAVAERLERDGRVDAAMAILAPVVGRSGQAAVKLATLLRATGRVKEAESTLRELSATAEPAAVRLADLLEEDGQGDQAIALLRDREDRGEQAALALARLLQARGARQDALEVLRPFAGKSESSTLKLAELLWQSGRRDEAIETLRQAPGRFEQLRVRLAAYLNASGRRAEAIASLRPLAASESVAVKLADLLANGGDVDEALNVLAPLRSRSEQAVLKSAELSSRHGDDERALELLAPMAGTHEAVGRRYAELLAAKGRVDDAVAILGPFAAENPQLALRLGEILAQYGRMERAVAIMRPLATTDPEVAIRLAEVLRRQGRDDEALTVLASTDRSEAVTLKLADALLRAGREDDALATLRARARRPAVAIKLAELLQSRGESDAAADVLAPLAGRFPDVGARLKKLQGRGNEPPHHIRGNFLAHAAKAHAEGRLAEAEEYLAPHARRSPTAALRLASVLSELDRVDDAVAVLEPWFASSEYAAVRLADILAKHGRADEAVERLRLRQAEPSEQAVVKLADLLRLRGDIEAAIQTLRPFVTRYEQPAVRLAEILEDRDPDKALEILQDAPQFEQVRMKRADILAALHRFDEARDALSSLGSDRPGADGRLAALDMLLGDKKTALARLDNPPRPHALSFRAAAKVLARDGRIDLLRLLVDELPMRSALAPAIATQILLAARAHLAGSGGARVDAAAVARQVWAGRGARRRAARQVAGTLLAWSKGERSASASLDIEQVVSSMETLTALSPRAPLAVKRAVSARLERSVRDDPRRLAELKGLTNESDFARSLHRVLRRKARGSSRPS